MLGKARLFCALFAATLSLALLGGGVAEGAGRRHATPSPTAGRHHAAPPPAPHTLAYRVIHMRGSLSHGAHGPAVRLLQDELARLRYEVPVSGRFDAATGRAVLAFRKVVGLERIESANAGVFQRLQHGGGHFKVRYPGDGKHVEGDLSKQVLAEIEHGKVRRIYTMSS